MYNFRNDYSAGAHPDVLAAVSAVNLEGNSGYGTDPHCAAASDLIRSLCKAPDASVHFFIGGTSANATSLCAFLRPWDAVLCAETGHINVHEGGAVEATGHKVLTVPTTNGKLTPDLAEPVLRLHLDEHMVHPKLLYISDATEIGTVYTKAELTALSRFCRSHDLYLFLDGARLGCALTSAESDLTLPDIAALTDAFYIGGTKNGALMGEAMVITNPDLQPYFFRVMKQRGAVLAKGFLLGAQFEALLRDDLYWECARHSNELGQKLQAGLIEKGYPMLFPSPTNQIFPVFPDDKLPELESLCFFEVWGKPDEAHTAVRFVTSFATPAGDVDGLLNAL